MNSSNSVESSPQTFDPLSTVRQNFSYEEENNSRDNSNYSKLESLKQRISDLCRADTSVLSHDTRSTFSTPLNSTSSSRAQRSHIQEKLEVKRDKYVSMRNYYSSLMDFTREKARISLRELRNFREEIIEGLDRQLELERIHIVKHEKDILQEIGESYHSCDAMAEEISALIKKLALNPNHLQLMKQTAEIIHAEDPEPIQSFASIRFESSFHRSDRAVQTSPLKNVKDYL